MIQKKTAREKALELIPQRREVSSLAVTQKQEIKKPDHKCEWEMVSKTQAPPRRDISVEALKNFSAADNPLLEKMLFGVTVLMWECVLCKDIRKEEVLGSDITQLDEMVDKADKYGPQYLQRADGTTFVLARHQAAPTSVGLPLR